MARISGPDRSEWSKHGRVRVDAKDRAVFIIREQRAGKRYEFSTRCHTLAAALKEWERFDRDPVNYRPPGDGPDPILLDEDLSEDFLRWSLKDQGNTEAWVQKQRSALAWWAEKLKGVDLRRATLGEHVVPALDRATDRATRIRVLKTLYSWLRKVRHTISPAEDPTMDALVAPQAKPAQLTKSKVIPKEHYLLVRDALTSPWREALIVQAGSAWHTTEVIRFAEGGSIEPLPPAMRVQNGAVAVLICPLHKSGAPHRTAVSTEVLEAAKALLKHGSFSREWYDRAVRSACKTIKRPDGKIGIPVFTPGRFRHSVATWAIEAGADPAAVAAFLGHKSPSTTKKFYATHATAPKVPTLA